MKILIENRKERYVLWNDKFIETKQWTDVTFSDALRLGRIVPVRAVFDDRKAYNPTHWKEKRFNLMCDVDHSSGWGNVSTNLIRYSRDNGYEISLLGRTHNVSEPSVLTAANRDLLPDAAMVWHDQPRKEWLQSPFAKNIAIVPFETTRIPESWVERINKFDALLVPCKQNVDAFRDSGVTIPIDIIHWGIDTDKFHEIERPDDGIFTFGTMGALSLRKGTDLVNKAFKIAFPTEQDVRLICKTSFNVYEFMEKDKRIKVDMTPVSHEELMNGFFKNVDCFVFPTRGEGFGLTPLEAMSTGIPAIVTNWSGPAEYMNEEVGYPLKYSMAPATPFSKDIYKEECGDWAEPDLDHLVALMRHAYENQKEVLEKGKKAAEYVRNEWTWDKKIKMFHEALNKHL